MGKNWAILNRYISVITDIDGKWFVIFELTINRLSFGDVRLPQLEYFFFFFVFLLRLSTFKPLNALYSKFERLKISGKTSVGMKWGVQSCGDPPQLGPPKF